MKTFTFLSLLFLFAGLVGYLRQYFKKDNNAPVKPKEQLNEVSASYSGKKLLLESLVLLELGLFAYIVFIQYTHQYSVSCDIQWKNEPVDCDLRYNFESYPWWWLVLILIFVTGLKKVTKVHHNSSVWLVTALVGLFVATTLLGNLIVKPGDYFSYYFILIAASAILVKVLFQLYTPENRKDFWIQSVVPIVLLFWTSVFPILYFLALSEYRRDVIMHG